MAENKCFLTLDTFMTVVQIAQNFKDIDICLHTLEKLVKTVCSRFTERRTPDTRYEISVALVDDTGIRKLNTRFLNRNVTTDCLSFDLSDSQPNSTKTFELVVNAEMAVKQARLRGHSSQAELALYIIHALLHRFGFDDSEKQQAKKMHDTEDEILQQFGFGAVYNRKSEQQIH